MARKTSRSRKTVARKTRTAGGRGAKTKTTKKPAKSAAPTAAAEAKAMDRLGAWGPSRYSTR
jgi:hypothetical protein